jgi:hypothetical protein
VMLLSKHRLTKKTTSAEVLPISPVHLELDLSLSVPVEQTSNCVERWISPGVVTNLTSMNEASWHHRVTDTSLLSCPDLVDVMRRVFSPPSAEVAQVACFLHRKNWPHESIPQVSQRCLEYLANHRKASRGLLMDRNKLTEVTQTALLCAQLNHCAPDDIQFLHQVEMGGAKGDIVVVRADTIDPIPVGFFELAMELGSAKVGQTFGYANNLAQTLTPKLPSFLGIIARQNGKVQLRAYFATQPSKHICDLLLHEEPIETGLGSMLQTLLWWAGSDHHLALPAPTLPHGNNVRVRADRVLKLFDYRPALRRMQVVPAEHRRSPEFAEVHGGLVGFERLVSAQDFDLISYDYVAGDHTLRHTDEVVSLLGKVQTLHKKNLVYGDVHLSNILFDKESKTAQLIDFDFSGAAGEKMYPPGWLKIDDGKRHPDAVAGALLQTCHDTFSIAAVLRFFEPTEEAKEGWAAGLELLEKDDLAAALDSFKDLNSSIRVTDGARIPVAQATGSPPPADVAVLRKRRRHSNSTPAALTFNSPPRTRSSKRLQKGRFSFSSRSLAHHFLGIPCPSPRPFPSAHLSLHRFPSLILLPSPSFTSSSVLSTGSEDNGGAPLNDNDAV